VPTITVGKSGEGRLEKKGGRGVFPTFKGGEERGYVGMQQDLKKYFAGGDNETKTSKKGTGALRYQHSRWRDHL